jgi:ribosomal protein S18 acetylase RimI-like enzyme
MTATTPHSDLAPDDTDADLDTPVWRSLSTTHARFAQGGERARRFDPEVAAFVALRDGSPEAWLELADLVGPGEIVLLAGAAIEPPAGWTREGGGYGFQMVLGDLAARPDVDETIERLTTSDVPQILALIELTQPGPFRPRTIELGNYYGVFKDGQLVAMAGERLQTPRYTEISAVCTHPSARGRGLAAALSHHVATGILDRRQTPILHVAEHNVNAKRVYERLGFADRARIEFVAVRSPGPAAPAELDGSPIRLTP